MAVCIYKHFEDCTNYTNVRLLNIINEYLLGQKNVYIYVYIHTCIINISHIWHSVVYFSFSWPLFHAHQAMSLFKWFHLEQKVKKS